MGAVGDAAPHLVDFAVFGEGGAGGEEAADAGCGVDEGGEGGLGDVESVVVDGFGGVWLGSWSVSGFGGEGVMYLHEARSARMELLERGVRLS